MKNNYEVPEFEKSVINSALIIVTSDIEYYCYKDTCSGNCGKPILDEDDVD